MSTDLRAESAGVHAVPGPTTGGRPQRLLIVTGNLNPLRRHYEDVIVALVRAGVDVTVRHFSEGELSAEDYAESLRLRGCVVDLGVLPPEQPDPGDLLALRLRQLVNLLRFYHEDYRGRDWLRESKSGKKGYGPTQWARRLGRLGSPASLLAIRIASGVDRLLPPAKSACDVLAAERPDAVAAVGVVWTPKLVDFVKAASWQRIPTAVWILSWDNLTNKGLLHHTPDRVFVWNAMQRDELARYHRVPAQHVCVTGAQTFDDWFDGDAPAGRAEFCSQIGADPGKAIILYLASSRQIEPNPAVLFLRWLDAVRSSGVRSLEEAFVLVRPHPTSIERWFDLDLGDSGLSISPATREAPPTSRQFRQRYRNELHHASVAVGLNTSGMIEAAIFGKPVCTVELPELRGVQRGTIHFEYLTTIAGGLLRTAPSLEEHVDALAALLRRDPYKPDAQSTRFVEEFVRPYGLRVPAAGVFAREMLRLLAEPSEVGPPALPWRMVGGLVHRAAPVLGRSLEKKPKSRRGRPTSSRQLRAP